MICPGSSSDTKKGWPQRHITSHNITTHEIMRARARAREREREKEINRQVVNGLHASCCAGCTLGVEEHRQHRALRSASLGPPHGEHAAHTRALYDGGRRTNLLMDYLTGYSCDAAYMRAVETATAPAVLQPTSLSFTLPLGHRQPEVLELYSSSNSIRRNSGQT